MSATEIPSSVLRPEELENLGKPVSEARGMPPRVYTDPEIFEAEKDKIFNREWMAVLHESTVRNPGDYRVVELLGQSFLIVRGTDGELRGFHNICRHRGAKVAVGEGNCSKFRCPYHTWTYDLRGSLIGAPTMAHVVREGIGLVDLRIDTWLGFVFINIDGQAEPLASKVSRLDDVLAPWLDVDLEVVYELPYPGNWNWKLTYENTIEGYHVIGTHLDSAQPIAPGELTFTSTSDDDFETFTDFRMPYAAGMTMRDETGGSVPLDGVPSWVDEEARFYVVWPNFLFSLAPENLTGYIVLPGKGPGEVTFVWCNVARPETLQMPNFAEYKAAQELWSTTVQTEDQYPCETMWENMHSDSFIPGPYAEGERAVYHFNQWYMKRMSS
ncbi:aromatic ring-hydroxylating oxygenase subunit alpha [Conexibacter woesei]|uniref:Rieske (2Fe-2S) iron-sulphur domain protein n=1 Tax=Conexibacter woesei (strain DSM 14684 / CCUG 47730 / CIP 108061 / JCM 11494 / NBRC 100937 / ID131577) TaxID=469383 RepID=D3F3Q5_CONWI|nr:aromatic ring-hydroxylating dioxygenase subunit alpha [Conexibacter woesei]ADB52420.1 Rieske (2Fe-2S) iron-sulphur domain protein [Conexibacter woesei DSM 14684]